VHNSLSGMLVALVKEENNATDLEIRYATHQINNIGSIIASIIALMFINIFPQYGIFIIWFIALMTIIWLLKVEKLLD